MELGDEYPIETKTRWAARIQRSKEVEILFNRIQGDYDICG